ncbi:MAG: hypothetical protein AAGC71_06440 [Pseudomonadota bacterium]
MTYVKPAILLTLAFAGMVALIAVEMLQGAFGEDAASMVMPLAIVFSVSALPILLLTLFDGRWAFWVAFAIAVLMSLFHAMHIVEHGMAGDYGVTLLIAVAMFAPSLAAVVLLWMSRKASAVIAPPQQAAAIV